jgi:hypothetical protein
VTLTLWLGGQSSTLWGLTFQGFTSILVAFLAEMEVDCPSTPRRHLRMPTRTKRRNAAREFVIAELEAKETDNQPL